MSLTCVAIDDEPLALELVRSYVTRMPEVKLVGTFEDAISGIEFLSRKHPDLIFLDINMPDYIIPVFKVRSVQNKKIQLSTVVLPIGESYAEQVKQWLGIKTL